MTSTAVRPGARAAGNGGPPHVVDACLWDHRRALAAHCHRMLGSRADAEDAVQETLLRAWRSVDHFEGRASVRTWLYRIATNVCLDMIRSRRSRPLPVDVTEREAAGRAVKPSGVGRDDTGEPFGPGLFAPDLADSGRDDPAARVVAQEDVVSALRVLVSTLPPRQRAVLILRDVLCWRAQEVAELLGTSVASVNSALQRARATLSSHGQVGEDQPAHAAAAGGLLERGVLTNLVKALEHRDLQSLVALVKAPVSGE